jgi:hypothetical protein
MIQTDLLVLWGGVLQVSPSGHEAILNRSVFVGQMAYQWIVGKRLLTVNACAYQELWDEGCCSCVLDDRRNRQRPRPPCTTAYTANPLSRP